MNQGELFPTDPNVEPTDTPRLTGQNLRILNRLRLGPASNTELSGISLKYTSRISDLRKHGFDIECRRQAGGWNLYYLHLHGRGGA